MIGWERHRNLRNIKPPERVYISDETCESVQVGKIILITEIHQTTHFHKHKGKKVCKATCMNGKLCTHKPQTGLDFCKRHLKINQPEYS